MVFSETTCYDSRFNKDAQNLRKAWKSIDDWWSRRRQTEKSRKELQALRSGMYKTLDGLRDPSTFHSDSEYRNSMIRAGLLIQGLNELLNVIPAFTVSEKLDPKKEIERFRDDALENLINITGSINRLMDRSPNSNFTLDLCENLASILL